RLYMMVLPSFSSEIKPISLRLFSAGYIVPGLNFFSSFLLAISVANSWPCIGFFDNRKRIRNPSIPLISQQSFSFPCIAVLSHYEYIGYTIYINTSMLIYYIGCPMFWIRR